MAELVNRELMRERLKELFTGKTTREVAEEIGNITQQSVSCYLNGTRSPKVEFISRVSKFYNVNIQWLLGNPDAPKYPDLEDEGPEPDEDIVILSRAAKKMSPEDRQKLIEMAKVVFKDAFRDE